MTQQSETVQQVIDRLKSLQNYTVSIPVQENWTPNGVVPFNIKIKNGIATVTLPALSEEEAQSKLQAYFDATNGD